MLLEALAHVIAAEFDIVGPAHDGWTLVEMQNITAAGYIGYQPHRWRRCDYVAIRQPDVDWQVWIEKDETPLPRQAGHHE